MNNFQSETMTLTTANNRNEEQMEDNFFLRKQKFRKVGFIIKK